MSRKPKGDLDIKLICKEEIILQQPTLVLLLFVGKMHSQPTGVILRQRNVNPRNKHFNSKLLPAYLSSVLIGHSHHMPNFITRR